MPKGIGYGKKSAMKSKEHPVAKGGRKSFAKKRRAERNSMAAERSKGKQGRIASRKARHLGRKKVAKMSGGMKGMKHGRAY